MLKEQYRPRVAYPFTLIESSPNGLIKLHRVMIPHCDLLAEIKKDVYNGWVVKILDSWPLEEGKDCVELE